MADEEELAIDPAGSGDNGPAVDSASATKLAMLPSKLNTLRKVQPVALALVDAAGEVEYLTLADGVPVALMAGSEVEIASGQSVGITGTPTVNIAANQAVEIDPSGNQVTIAGTPSVKIRPGLASLTDTLTPGAQAVAQAEQVTIGVEYAVAGDSYCLHNAVLTCASAIFPAGCAVDLYVYDARDADITTPGIGNAWTTPLPAAVDGRLVGVARLSNPSSGLSQAVTGHGIDLCWDDSGVGFVTVYAVLQSSTGFTTANNMDLTLTVEQA